MGHCRCRRSLEMVTTLRFGQRAQRPHSPGDAKGRRTRRVSLRDVDRLSATCTGSRRLARPAQSACWKTGRIARNATDQRGAGKPLARHDRQADSNGGPFVSRAWILRCLFTMALAGWHTARANEPVVITIDRFQFAPDEITIEPGTTIEWINRDQTVHNIVSSQAKIASPGLDTADRFSFMFDHPGDFTYLCGLHPHMKGIIHVKERTS